MQGVDGGLVAEELRAVLVRVPRGILAAIDSEESRFNEPPGDQLVAPQVLDKRLVRFVGALFGHVKWVAMMFKRRERTGEKIF